MSLTEMSLPHSNESNSNVRGIGEKIFHELDVHHV